MNSKWDTYLEVNFSLLRIRIHTARRWSPTRKPSIMSSPTLHFCTRHYSVLHSLPLPPPIYVEINMKLNVGISKEPLHHLTSGSCYYACSYFIPHNSLGMLKQWRFVQGYPVSFMPGIWIQVFLVHYSVHYTALVVTVLLPNKSIFSP